VTAYTTDASKKLTKSCKTNPYEMSSLV